MDRIKILIADDHLLIVNGLKSMLEPIEEIKIVGTAGGGREAVEKAALLKPQVIIMDISMPDLSGIEATRMILKENPEIKILALTQHEDGEYIMQMTNAGVYGYLLKNSMKEEFIEAIFKVSQGEKYFSKEISHLLLNRLLRVNNGNDSENKNKVILTKREREIVQKIAEERSNAQIAEELNISLRTVETHRRNIMQKLNVKSVVSLLKYALENQIITIRK